MMPLIGIPYMTAIAIGWGLQPKSGFSESLGFFKRHPVAARGFTSLSLGPELAWLANSFGSRFCSEVVLCRAQFPHVSTDPDTSFRCPEPAATDGILAQEGRGGPQKAGPHQGLRGLGGSPWLDISADFFQNALLSRSCWCLVSTAALHTLPGRTL